MTDVTAGVLGSRRRRPGSSARALLLTRTYLHLLAAVAAVVVLEVAAFRSGVAQPLARAMSSVPWLLILGAFMVVAWMARKLAWRTRSLPAQYAGLAAYVVAKSVILIPLLYHADAMAPGALASAAQLTLVGFTGLTLVVFTTRRDFSFLRALLRWGGIIALVAIVGALVFRFRLGAWFDVAMIALAGASVLYDTSKVLRRYRRDRYVAASLELFASIAMMFWYALRLFRRSQR